MDPRAIRTRNAFLDAAETLQREKKTEDITVSAIVGLAGMSRQVFYEHFDGRDAVVGALMERTIRPLLQEYVKTYESTGDPEQAIEGLVAGMYKERDLLLNVVGGPALTYTLKLFTTPEQPMLRGVVDAILERQGELEPSLLEGVEDFLRAGAFRLLVASVREADSAEDAAKHANSVLGLLRASIVGS